jgi:hypothetical protein
MEDVKIKNAIAVAKAEADSKYNEAMRKFDAEKLNIVKMAVERDAGRPLA